MFQDPNVILGEIKLARDHVDRERSCRQQDDFLLTFPGLFGQLFDAEHGLLLTSMITVPSWLGFLWLWRRDRAQALYLGTGFVAIYLFFASYTLWNVSHYGNRFLMPIVALSVVPLGILVDRLPALVRKKPGPTLG